MPKVGSRRPPPRRSKQIPRHVTTTTWWLGGAAGTELATKSMMVPPKDRARRRWFDNLSSPPPHFPLMKTDAPFITHAPTPARTAETLEDGLRDVELAMRSLTGIHDTGGTVQEAINYHLRSGGRRTRASIGLEAASKLGIPRRDSIALATCTELLHNASLLHDDLQDRARERRERPAVWIEFGEDIAICAGDLLVSAAYASLASLSRTQRHGELIQAVHAAMTVVINGQARDLDLQNTALSDFTTYREVAGAKSGPFLGLPLELALIASACSEHCPTARSAAVDLAVAYQIADDLEDESADAGDERQPQCLNAVAVLRNAGQSDPGHAARQFGLAALRQAAHAAATLPHESGMPLLKCIEAIDAKLLTDAT